MKPMTDTQRIERLEKTLGALISWMAQSANAPIRPDEAKALLETLTKASH